MALCLDAVIFWGATSFNQDIDDWNTAQVTLMGCKFNLARISINEMDHRLAVIYL